MNVIRNVKFEALFDLGKNCVRLEYIPPSNLSQTSAILVIPIYRHELKFVVVDIKMKEQ